MPGEGEDISEGKDIFAGWKPKEKKKSGDRAPSHLAHADRTQRERTYRKAQRERGKRIRSKWSK